MSFLSQTFNSTSHSRRKSILKPELNLLREEDFPNVLPIIKNSFCSKQIPNVSKCVIRGSRKHLVINWQKITSDPIILGYVNTIIRDTFLELPLFLYKDDGERKGGGTRKNRGDADKGSNSTSETRTKAISTLNFHSFKKVRWFPPGNKPEETELLCGIQNISRWKGFFS